MRNQMEFMFHCSPSSMGTHRLGSFAYLHVICGHRAKHLHLVSRSLLPEGLQCLRKGTISSEVGLGQRDKMQHRTGPRQAAALLALPWPWEAGPQQGEHSPSSDSATEL